MQHAWYVYDGDGNMVKGIVNFTTTYYPARHYNKEVNGADVKVQKTYFAASLMIAVRTIEGAEDTLHWVLTDHLNSTSVTANEDGTLNSTIQYTAFGVVRSSTGLTPTDYRYTGQLAQDVLGLDYSVARWYDTVTVHFTSGDSIIPNKYKPNNRDRFAYVHNNPIRYIDPSGYKEECAFENCNEQRRQERLFKELGLIDYVRNQINEEFGIAMENSDTRTWSKVNVITAYSALSMVNVKLNGNLKAMVGGTKFTIMDGGKQYWGQTNSKGVDYHTFDGNTKLPLINFLHEMGHLLNSVPEFNNAFSTQISGTPSWVRDGYVNREILLDKFSQPVQAIPMNEPYDPWEYWADSFANYVAENINLMDNRGLDMANYVRNALNPYIIP